MVCVHYSQFSTRGELSNLLHLLSLQQLDQPVPLEVRQTLHNQLIDMVSEGELVCGFDKNNTLTWCRVNTPTQREMFIAKVRLFFAKWFGW